MKKDIQEIIEKSLPKQVGETLQKRLKELEEKEALLELKEKELTNSNLELISIKKRNAELSNDILKFIDIESREKVLKNSELRNEYEKKFDALKLEEAEKRFTAVDGYTKGLVRNTEFRKTVFDSETGPNGKDQYGNEIYATHSKNTTETITKE